MDRATRLQAKANLIHALSPLAPYFEDGSVLEVMVNGPDDVWVERQGAGMTKEVVSIREEQIVAAITLLARLDNKHATPGTPDAIIDTRLDGMRVAAALPPTAVHGPMICIRKHSPLVLRLEDYVAADAMTQETAELLRQMVQEHKNVIVVGGTSSGKTTLMNALLAEVDHSERVFTIEDIQELKILAPHWVAMEANEQAGITMRNLIRLALRSRPDRLIIGEVRGGEAYDLMQASNTGHDGSVASVHANSAFAGLSRLEMLVLASGVGWPYDAIRTQIANTFDYVIFMARRNGRRRLEEVIHLSGYDSTAKEYRYETVFSRRPDHVRTLPQLQTSH